MVDLIIEKKERMSTLQAGHFGNALPRRRQPESETREWYDCCLEEERTSMGDLAMDFGPRGRRF